MKQKVTHMQRRDCLEDMHPKSLCGGFHPGTSTQCWGNVTCKNCIGIKKQLDKTDGVKYWGKFPSVSELRYHGNTVGMKGDE